MNSFQMSGPNYLVSRTFRVNISVKRAKMKLMLVSLYLSLLLLLLAAVIPVMTRLQSITVVSYTEPRKTKNGPRLCALDRPNETMSHDRQQCSLKCARDVPCAGYNIKNSHSHSPVG